MNKVSGQIVQSVEIRPVPCERSFRGQIKVERSLKEQYHVTVHVPNFDFLTGCREFKRCMRGE